MNLFEGQAFLANTKMGLINGFFLRKMPKNSLDREQKLFFKK
jgi:hypothetical protein